MTPDVWQREFDDIRRKYPMPAGGFVRRRLVILPRAMRFLNRGFGAGFVWLFWIFIDSAVVDAPADVRRYLLLHEWGHVRRKHNLVGIFAMTLAPLALYLPVVMPSFHTHQAQKIAAIIGLVALGIEFFLYGWAMNEKREFEADAFVAAELGPIGTIDAMGKMILRYGRGWTPLRVNRRAALYRLMAASPKE